MGKKPKARGSPPKAEKPKAATEEKAQFERFVETARSHGVDESGKPLERAMNKIIKRRQGPGIP
jgi:hypothetical protein